MCGLELSKNVKWSGHGLILQRRVPGRSSNPLDNSDLLAQEGAILVKLQLPLRPFGWLEPLELDDGGHPSGNFGLQDTNACCVELGAAECYSLCRRPRHAR